MNLIFQGCLTPHIRWYVTLMIPKRSSAPHKCGKIMSKDLLPAANHLPAWSFQPSGSPVAGRPNATVGRRWVITQLDQKETHLPYCLTKVDMKPTMTLYLLSFHTFPDLIMHESLAYVNPKRFFFFCLHPKKDFLFQLTSSNSFPPTTGRIETTFLNPIKSQWMKSSLVLH